jgi:Ca-activated chloride channel homolog
MFANPSYLLWGALGAAAALLLAWRGDGRRKAAAASLGRSETLARLLPPELSRRRRLKGRLGLAGLLLLFAALAGPQWGVELLATESRARDIIIAVDVSLSMLAEDVKPNRMERAQEELSLLLDQLAGERVGILAFAGDAFMTCPMTTDIDAAKQILRSLAPGAVPVPGTSIGEAIRYATRTLSRYSGERTLVLLTDGEDQKTDPAGAAKEAARAGVRIFTIGIGSPNGEPIPLRNSAGQLEGYKKNKRGETVVSKLGEEALADVAQTTGGAYFRASPGQDEVAEIVQKIKAAEKGEAVQGTQSRYQNRFMIPLLLAFLLLLLDFIVPEKAGFRERVRLVFKRRSAAVLAMLLVTPSFGATSESSLRKGNKLYDQGKYENSLEQYAIAGKKSPKDPRPVFNAGDALYRIEKFDEASEAFKAAASSPKHGAAAYYNLGNSRFKAQDFDGAVAAFRKAVVLDPGDAAARHNLAVALKRAKDPPPKKDKPDDKDDKKKDKGQDKGKDQPDNGRPPEPKTRPQDQMSKEDAERIMRAVAEKEKSAPPPLQLQKDSARPPEAEEDW